MSTSQQSKTADDPKYQRMADGQRTYTPHMRNVSDSLSHKFVLYGNLFFVLLGGVVIGIGYHLKASHAGSFLRQNLGLGLIVLGAAVLIISFLGCMGAKCASRSMILLYALVMMLVIICQIGIAAFVVTRSNDVNSLVTTRWDDLATAQQQQLEQQFGCCGLNSFNDSRAALPCPAGTDTGCVDKLHNDLRHELLAVGGAALAFAIVEVLGVLCACSLAAAIKGAAEAEDDDNERLRQAREVNRQVGVQP